MNFPPPGYDDPSIIAQKRLKRILGDFEEDLKKVEKVFQQHYPGEFHVSEKMDRDFIHLRECAHDLGSHYIFLIEKLIEDYEQFRIYPDKEKLDQIFSDVKSLELLLTE